MIPQQIFVFQIHDLLLLEVHLCKQEYGKSLNHKVTLNVLIYARTSKGLQSYESIEITNKGIIYIFYW